MREPRVCLIVDHPARDLEGLVLLALALTRRGAEVFLVPMYQRHEALLLRPDVVVANYARYANATFLAAARHVGIRVVVLDTEGGVVQDTRSFAERVRPYLPYVDAYCVWGEQQARALLAVRTGEAPDIVVTGCPRYDFAAPQWTAALPDVDVPDGRMVLVNTNFPLLRPRFQSMEREVHDLVHRIGYDEAWIREFIEQARHARAEVVRATSSLAAAFPHVTFVIRPHPFENADVYQAAAAANVRVTNAGSVFPWVQRAHAVIHFHCSTAVEAVMMRREPILLDWIDAPHLHQPASAAISRHATSLERLHELIGRCLDDTLPPDAALDERRRDVLRTYFGAADGNASVRAAEAILVQAQAAGADAATPVSAPRYLIELASALRPRGAVLMGAGALLGGRNHERLRCWLGRAQSVAAKRFDDQAVNRILDRIHIVDAQARSVRARQGTPAETVLRAGGSLMSVRVGHAA